MSDHLLVLSTSSVTEYLRCHHRYFLGHVYRMRGAQSVPAAIGQAVHAGVEALHKGGIPMSPDSALRKAFDEEWDNVPFPWEEDPSVALADARKMLEVYKKEVLPRFHPTLVEAPFAVKVEGIIISGTIDAADVDVHDTKTTAGKTINGRKPRFDPANYDMQLALYRLGYKGLTGTWPRRTVLDVLTRRGTYREVEREVSVRDALDVVGVVRDGIARGDFEPTGAMSGACNWCAYAIRCAYAKTE